MRVLVAGDRGSTRAARRPAPVRSRAWDQREMSTIPRVTIGLPVYNGENYLAELLDALLGQSYEDFELVISDNASTDATAEICRHYEKRDSRIRFFRQPSNVGLAPRTTTSS